MSETPISADEARHRLYEIMKGDEPFEQKTREALLLGTSYLGVESGFLTRIERTTDHWETIISTDSDDGPVPAGVSTTLSGMYCRHTLERDSPLAVHDATQGFSEDAARDGFYCYHGTTVNVDGEPFGTVCFVAREPRAELFSDAETMFAELVGRLIEHELEHQRQQEELTRQTSLVNLLDRVLRHNIRNKMTVVRANAQLHSQKQDDCPECQKIISSADDLIQMTETARHLGKILNTDDERGAVDLIELLEEIAFEVSHSYPDIDLDIEGPDELVVQVLPSLETALWELIENAAEYAGPAPHVVVHVTAAGDSVEIRVADDGPGLPESEQDVLQTGTETQLVHGSGLGLWAVYWIVTAHHGEITIDTTDGTAVTLSIPNKQLASVETEPVLERAGDRYQAAFDQATTGMVLLDDEGHLIELNERATALFDRSDEELLGKHIDAVTADGQTISDLVTRTQNTIDLEGGQHRQFEYTLRQDIVPNQHLLILEKTGTNGNSQR